MTQPDVISPTSRLHLLGRFMLFNADRPVPVTAIGAKLFAVLALHRRPMPRPLLAETIWPDRPSGRARANLRSVIWRLPEPSRRLLREDGEFLTLRPGVVVDVDQVVQRCHSLLATNCDPGPVVGSPDDLLDDLLPTWDDDWVLVERARLRQLRLHALEALSAGLLRAGRVGEAMDAAAAALAAEPLRDSAARAVISVHLASGNVAHAHRVYRTYRAELVRELGIEPSPRLLALLQDGDRQMTTG